MTFLLVVAYEIVALLASRKAYASLRTTDMAPTDTFEVGVMGFLILMASQFWPLALPIAAVLWHPRETQAEVLEENQRMQHRITELERELGIGGTR